MGCLLPYLKTYSQNVHIGQFKGQTAAVDGFCWLHRALSASITRTGKFDRCMNKFFQTFALNGICNLRFNYFLNCSYVDICKGYLDVLLNNGVTAFVVFDGLGLPAKADVKDLRAR